MLYGSYYVYYRFKYNIMNVYSVILVKFSNPNDIVEVISIGSSAINAANFAESQNPGYIVKSSDII